MGWDGIEGAGCGDVGGAMVLVVVKVLLVAMLVKQCTWLMWYY